MYTYSFLDTHGAIVGPGGSINLGAGAGIAEEGITIDPAEDIGSMTIGADGSGMHALHANKSGSVTVRLLKDSPTNSLLQAMYDYQTASSSNYGQNTISFANTVSGDSITCQQVAFARRPSITYAKQAQLLEWKFNCVKIDGILGAGI